MAFHKEQLQKNCRVYGKRLRKGRSFVCYSNCKLLQETLKFDVFQDLSDPHPPSTALVAKE